MIALRPYPYQSELLDGIEREISAGHRRVLAVMPTGAGKGTTTALMVKTRAERGCRTLVLAHREELVSDLSGRIQGMGIEHGVIRAGQESMMDLPVQVGSVWSVANRLEQIPDPGMIIQDEAHHLVENNTWGRIVQRWPRALLIGKTATPCRLDGRGLGEGQGGFFTAMVLGPSSAWLTDHGYLAPARVLSIPIGFDAKAVGRRAGDFRMDQAEQQLGTRQVGDAIGHYLHYMAGKTAIVFCCSVAHAEEVAASFRESGVSAASIDGSTKNRAELLARLGDSSLQVLTSCQLIGEGVDVPSVGGCILLRPTQSESLHLQMIGRALRPQPGKVAIIMDHVGNVRRLGHHLEDREWTLNGRRQRHREKSESVATCPVCFSSIRSGPALCPECGYQFESKQKRRLQVVDGKLREVSLDEARLLARARKTEQGKATTIEELVELGRKRGMKNPLGWARHVLKARHAHGQRRGVV